MRMRFFAAATLLMQVLPLATFAATLSGVMIYSADHYGNPNAWNAQKEEFALGQAWRTQLGGDWYGLGLLPGLPPANSDVPVLNAPNFGIQIPLVEGDNEFTLVGEPSVLTRQEEFSHFVLNLYFDGVVQRPGISVLFPRFSPRGGSPPLPNVAPVTYALSLSPAKATAESMYSDGVDRVTVTAVSFLPPEKFGVDYDKVSAHAVLPSSASGGSNGGGADGLGGFDYVGVLRIHVEGPDSAVAPGAPAAPAVPAVPVVMPGVAVGPSLGGDADGRGGAGAGDLPNTRENGSSGSAATMPANATEASPVPVQTPTPGATVMQAETTPTLAPTALATAAVTSRAVTPTPVATRESVPPGGTPTDQMAPPARTPPRQESAAAPGERKSREPGAGSGTR